MKPVILFRKDPDNAKEYAVAEKYFDVCTQRGEIPVNRLVISRYATLPFHRELENDVGLVSRHSSKLVNTTEQHNWIANFDYYEDLKRFTPESWNDSNFHLCQHPGPFVVKGRTNSRKFQWNTKMFAATKADALSVASDLLSDGQICDQGIIYRKFVPLKVFEVGINDLPFSNEWRFFFYKNNLLSSGYYWSTAEHIPEKADKACIDFAQQVASVVKDHVNFFVLDIAETLDGQWILIEVNDGTMSGLSENNPDELYGNLKKVFADELRSKATTDDKIREELRQYERRIFGEAKR
jgi:hypothetical protein